MILHFYTFEVSLQTTSETANNYSLTTIRYNQQKWHPLIPFENNGTLQKWHLTKTPSEIDKYDTQKRWCFTKMTHLAKKCPEVIYQGLT